MQNFSFHYETGDIMGLWDEIKEIAEDIFADVKIEEKRQDDFAKFYCKYERKNHMHIPWVRQTSKGIPGFIVIIMPNVIGFAVGLAMARMVNLSSVAAYLISGIIFAVIIGTLQHVISGGMSLKAAVIRNILIVMICCLIFILAMIWGSIM